MDDREDDTRGQSSGVGLIHLPSVWALLTDAAEAGFVSLAWRSLGRPSKTSLGLPDRRRVRLVVGHRGDRGRH